MSLFRQSLPQLGPGLFLADGGIETTLIFLDGLELPHFAAFHLMRDDAGRGALRKYFRAYTELAKERGLGLVLETATWRASQDWGTKLGYTAAQMAEVNRTSVAMLEEIRAEVDVPVVISGCVGPRGDGYVPGASMSADEAAEYHSAQVEAFADSAADLVTAITMNYIEEAVGVVRAAQQAKMPVVISFTVETDGKLPGGRTLAAAIGQVDAETDGYPAYYMVNCAHPDHFANVLKGPWLKRLRGVRANASRMSHAELNEATTLDAGDPAELAGQYASLIQNLPNFSVMGGCCGTDHRHIAAIAEACAPAFQKRAST